MRIVCLLSHVHIKSRRRVSISALPGSFFIRSVVEGLS